MKPLMTSLALATLALGITGCQINSCPPVQSGDPDTIKPLTETAWTIDPNQSAVHYITIKNNSIAETNTFGEFSGSITMDGQAELVIKLDSVDTAIETRDERMKTHLFQTDQYPTTTISAQLEPKTFENMAIGQTIILDQTFQIALHGIMVDYDISIQVMRLGPNKIIVNNARPIIIQAEDFGFEAGLAKLQELAGLNAISPVVPVSVSLTLTRS